jgi:hypothetical protein
MNKRPIVRASPSISRVILYVKDIDKIAVFYETFFGMMRGEEALSDTDR